MALRTYRQLFKPCLPEGIGPAVGAALTAGIEAWGWHDLPYRKSHDLGLRAWSTRASSIPTTAARIGKTCSRPSSMPARLRRRDPGVEADHQQPASRWPRDGRLSRLDFAHRCRVVLVPDFLSEADMLGLARASTFYLTTTRAEGTACRL